MRAVLKMDYGRGRRSPQIHRRRGDFFADGEFAGKFTRPLFYPDEKGDHFQNLQNATRNEGHRFGVVN